MKVTLFQFFCAALILNALASVAIAGVPLPWISLAGVTFVGIGLLPRVRAGRQAFALLWMIIGWAAVLSLLNWTSFQDRMPAEASVSYPVYVLLRYLNILSFAGCLAVVLRLCETGHHGPIVRFVIGLGVVVSAYAIYVYFAQLFGWPEPLPRSRLGTGGGEQSTTFTYAFHRALGSFREPSHLAEWLMVPFILSFERGAGLIDLRRWIIGIALLLTGSITGIVSLLLGFVAALALLALSGRFLRLAAQNKGAIVGYLLMAVLLVLALDAALSGLLLQVVFDRSFSLVLDGVQESNRDYVYEYARSAATPLLGAGPGNSNIAFSNATDNDLITSYLSLYLNAYFNLGFVGLALTLTLLGLPLLGILARGRRAWPSGLFIATWAYVAWLVAFVANSEEFTVMFALAYALLLHRSRKGTAVTVRARSPARRFGAKAVDLSSGGDPVASATPSSLSAPGRDAPLVPAQPNGPAR